MAYLHFPAGGHEFFHQPPVTVFLRARGKENEKAKGCVTIASLRYQDFLVLLASRSRTRTGGWKNNCPPAPRHPGATLKRPKEDENSENMTLFGLKKEKEAEKRLFSLYFRFFIRFIVAPQF